MRNDIFLLRNDNLIRVYTRNFKSLRVHSIFQNNDIRIENYIFLNFVLIYGTIHNTKIKSCNTIQLGV